MRMPRTQISMRSGALLAALLFASLVPLAPRADPEAPAPAAPALAAPTDSAGARPEENAFPVTLGSFSTTLIGSLPDRTANIRLASYALDGTVLEPGDLLSFNRVVGPRTRERGYRPAPVILHELRQIQIGGGVCQVASTLFTAALLSGLTSVERSRHSSPVDYIALGEDATIAWEVKDLKLRNDLEQRVRLRVEVLGSTMTVRFEGENAVPDDFELETVERELPADPGAEVAPGREIELYRVRRTGGETVGREFVHRDTYPPSRSTSTSGGR